MQQDLLYKYFNRETTPQEEEDIAKWLDEASENSTIFQKERHKYNMILLLSKDEQLQSRKKIRFIPNWLKEIGKIAAVVMIMFSIGYYYQSSMQDKHSSAMNVVSVPAGQRVNLVLPDGTHICMNAKSRLEYPSIFVGESRRVKLTGEAFFNVIHNNGNAFIVETPDCEVEVLGTSFNIEAYPESNAFATALLEGSVKITNKKDPAKPIILEPNQQVRLVNEKLEISDIQDFDVLRWREGLICFKNKPFKQLIEQFEKYYDVRIIIENNKLLEHELSGKIRITDGIEHALRVIQKNTSFSYTRDSKLENVIYIK